MDREYKLIEVLKRIVEFPNEEYIDSETGISIKNKDNIISFYKDGEIIKICGLNLNYKLKKVDKKVEFIKALNEYVGNKKTIESTLNGVIRTYRYNPLELINQFGRGVSAAEILEGKWYIED